MTKTFEPISHAVPLDLPDLATLPPQDQQQAELIIQQEAQLLQDDLVRFAIEQYGANALLGLRIYGPLPVEYPALLQEGYVRGRLSRSLCPRLTLFSRSRCTKSAPRAFQLSSRRPSHHFAAVTAVVLPSRRKRLDLPPADGTRTLVERAAPTSTRPCSAWKTTFSLDLVTRRMARAEHTLEESAARLPPDEARQPPVGSVQQQVEAEGQVSSAEVCRPVRSLECVGTTIDTVQLAGDDFALFDDPLARQSRFATTAAQPVVPPYLENLPWAAQQYVKRMRALQEQEEVAALAQAAGVSASPRFFLRDSSTYIPVLRSEPPSPSSCHSAPSADSPPPPSHRTTAHGWLLSRSSASSRGESCAYASQPYRTPASNASRSDCPTDSARTTRCRRRRSLPTRRRPARPTSRQGGGTASDDRPRPRRRRSAARSGWSDVRSSTAGAAVAASSASAGRAVEGERLEGRAALVDEQNMST